MDEFKKDKRIIRDIERIIVHEKLEMTWGVMLRNIEIPSRHGGSSI